MVFISSWSITPSALMSNFLKAALASETLPKVIPMEQKEAEETEEVNEEVVVLELEKEAEEVCLKDEEEETAMEEVAEKPALGTMTARNSSRSIAPSLLVSPSLKMASTSVLPSLTPAMLALAISCFVISPSPSRSMALKALMAPSLPLKVWLTLKTTAVAEGHITPMNSSISISPSLLVSPRAKTALTSCSLRPAADISFLLIMPSLSLSSFLKPILISSRLL